MIELLTNVCTVVSFVWLGANLAWLLRSFLRENAVPDEETKETIQ